MIILIPFWWVYLASEQGNAQKEEEEEKDFNSLLKFLSQKPLTYKLFEILKPI